MSGFFCWRVQDMCPVRGCNPSPREKRDPALVARIAELETELKKLEAVAEAAEKLDDNSHACAEDYHNYVCIDKSDYCEFQSALDALEDRNVRAADET